MVQRRLRLANLDGLEELFDISLPTRLHLIHLPEPLLCNQLAQCLSTVLRRFGSHGFPVLKKHKTKAS